MIALAILAAASAWLVTRKAPQHRPLASALTVCAGLDAVRLLGLPARVDMALMLGCPIISGYAYAVTFCGAVPRWPYALAWFSLAIWTAIASRTVWLFLPAVAYVWGISIGFTAATPRPSRQWTISQRVALILLAGDALAVASLCAREWISYQAGVVLAGVTVYQLTWWWRWRQCESM